MNDSPQQTRSNIAEVRLVGIAVSRGTASGHAICLFGKKRQFFRIDLSPSELNAEIDRFRAAIEQSSREIRDLIRSADGVSASFAGIFEVQSLILESPTFAEDVENLIATDLVNAEWALRLVTEQLIAEQKTVADPTFREKYLDILDLGERIMSSLSGRETPRPFADRGMIVVAAEIKPSTLIELALNKPAAIVTSHGGWTSHAFIMARAMQIPAVTGIRDLMISISDGDPVYVDGFSGSVVVRPSVVFRSGLQGETVTLDNTTSRGTAHTSVATVDHHQIVLRANAEHIESVHELDEYGANGIGLLRSEYLFRTHVGSFPSEDAQFLAYRNVFERAGGHEVRIRTFDLNADQLSFDSSDREGNPSLGLKAIRLSLANEADLRIQIRSIVRAAAGHRVGIVLPMVSGLDEIVRVRHILEDEQVGTFDGPSKEHISLGVMIEVPAAVLTIDAIIEIVDFVCLGTNDLVQYLLAVDRDNESVANWYQTLHPAVLSSIQKVLEAANSAEKSAVVCGEMGGSPFYVPLLIGLGARELSMKLNSIAAVRTVIEGISFEEAAELAGLARRSRTAVEIDALIKTFHASRWPHLFPDDLGPTDEFSLTPGNIVEK